MAQPLHAKLHHKISSESIIKLIDERLKINIVINSKVSEFQSIAKQSMLSIFVCLTLAQTGLCQFVLSASRRSCFRGETAHTKIVRELLLRERENESFNSVASQQTI